MALIFCTFYRQSDMRADGDMSSNAYKEKRAEADSRIDEIDRLIAQYEIDKGKNQKKALERMIFMALAEATKTTEHTYTINDAMDVLLGKLDEAIDDMENGRVQTIEEAWEEIDRV